MSLSRDKKRLIRGSDFIECWLILNIFVDNISGIKQIWRYTCINNYSEVDMQEKKDVTRLTAKMHQE